MAEQTEPVRRKVALKLIKPGMDSGQVVARFEAERQALALMDHPNIAKVLDGGATAAGRPYFVMELVKGVPITRYSDEHRLTPRQRLELFVPVCEAVQHAHQKGVIHRDLKPSNALVALYDGRPVPKVIDFGVAKAAGQPLTDKTLFTGFGAVVGTLEYMSPEQAQLNQLDIDTRSDVYSLGVLLYELLTGTTPLERKRLKDTGLLEVLRLIQEEEPPRPSVRLSTTEELPAIAASRGLDPKRLSGAIRGELDWIVMKALEKDRSRRYETASAFAADVRRYLVDEPVLACPPSAAYRFRKFARRNKGRLAAVAVTLIFLALVGGVGAWAAWDRGVRWAALEADVSRDLDEARAFCRDDRLREASAVVDHAQALAARGGAGREFAGRVARLRTDVDMAARLEAIRLERASVKDGNFDFAGADARYEDAFRDYGLDVTLLDADAAAARVQASAIKDQLLAALGDWLVAQSAAAGGSPDRRLLDVLRRADPDPWRGRLLEAFGGGDRRALEELAGDPKAADQPPAALVLLGVALKRLDDLPLAVDVLRSAQQRHPNDFWVNHELALALDESRPPQPAEAVGYYRAALALRPDSPGVHLNLGNVLGKLGKPAQAADEYRAAIALKRDYAQAHCYLGEALARLRQAAEAEDELRQAVAVQPDLAEAHERLGYFLDGGKHDYGGAVAEFRTVLALRPDYARGHYNLGGSLYHQGDAAGAGAEWRKAIALRYEGAEVHSNLGSALADQGDLAGAVAEFKKAIELDPKFAFAHDNLGLALVTEGDLAGAVAEFKKAIALKPDHAKAHYNLGHALSDQGKLDEAAAAYRKAIALQPDYAEAHSNLGLALHDQGDLAGAVAEYRTAVALKPDLAPAHNNLGNALRDQGDLTGAVAEFKKAIALKPDYPEAHCNLGNALRDQGDLAVAVAEYRKAVELKPDFAEAHCNLGTALLDKGLEDDAITEFRKAVALKPDFARAHSGVGLVLRNKGLLDDAIAEFRKAVALKPDYAHAHCNLGSALLLHGEFREALAEMRRGHELGSKAPRWKYPSAEWVRQYERVVELDGRLPDFLDGKATPSGPDERIELAQLCALKGLNRGAARFYEEAFGGRPEAVAKLLAAHRYNAACAAALAGCGQGKDAVKLDDPERVRLRGQALNWLRADLEAWSRLLDRERDEARPLVIRTLQHWLVDPDFMGVRGPEALARLPESERQDWRRLWDDVADRLKRAQDKAAPVKNSGRK
jgi:Tfp pilus assembly protein PilF